MNLTISNWYLLWISSIFTKSHLPGFGVTEYSSVGDKGLGARSYVEICLMLRSWNWFNNGCLKWNCMPVPSFNTEDIRENCNCTLSYLEYHLDKGNHQSWSIFNGYRISNQKNALLIPQLYKDRSTFLSLALRAHNIAACCSVLSEFITIWYSWWL